MNKNSTVKEAVKNYNKKKSKLTILQAIEPSQYDSKTISDEVNLLSAEMQQIEKNVRTAIAVNGIYNNIDVHNLVCQSIFGEISRTELAAALGQSYASVCNLVSRALRCPM